jgi:hypothetical protein
MLLQIESKALAVVYNFWYFSSNDVHHLVISWQKEAPNKQQDRFWDKNFFTADRETNKLLRHVSRRRFFNLRQNALQNGFSSADRRDTHVDTKSIKGQTNLHAPNILAISFLLQINQRVDARPGGTCRVNFLHIRLKCCLVCPVAHG